ncbi:thioredoxin family protein [Mycoplasmopsis sturni]|uniref:thioredoxin family protein n=1 Tax=Mycoplasmopsis sturni TaxID=39047 RepID=UPI00055BC360|nr:thioredoxin family protein [Mycoplasmopsis sturni]
MIKLPWKDAEKLISQNPEDQLMFVMFTVTWCGDCKMMMPVVKKLDEKYSGNSKIQFLEVDAEEAQLFRNPNTKWEVLKAPTLMLLKGTEIVEKGYEYIPDQVLTEWIEKKL